MPELLDQFYSQEPSAVNDATARELFYDMDLCAASVFSYSPGHFEEFVLVWLHSRLRQAIPWRPGARFLVWACLLARFTSIGVDDCLRFFALYFFATHDPCCRIDHLAMQIDLTLDKKRMMGGDKASFKPRLF